MLSFLLGLSIINYKLLFMNENVNTPKASNGMATASLILGIVSIVFSFFWIIAVICGILAVVLGIVAKGKIKRSEEHTSELQSRPHLVCRLLLEKKKKLRSKSS